MATEGYFHRTFSSSYRKIGSCQCMVCKDDNAILDATIHMLLLIMNILPTPSYLNKKWIFGHPDVITITGLTERLVTMMTSLGCQ